MIISASRRTDIPAFYSRWMMERLHRGVVEIVNPFNARQRQSISLRPDDVDGLVFWTRNPEPLLPHLNWLEYQGYLFYFQFTLTGYPRALERHVPPLEFALHQFKTLSQKVGSSRVIWRYDPILISKITPLDYHRHQFERLARQLAPYCERVVISFYDPYPRVQRVLDKLALDVLDLHQYSDEAKALAISLARIAKDAGLAIQSCAETLDLSQEGIAPGACIDGQLLNRLGAKIVITAKDRAQRQHCQCLISKDIGSYHSCLHGCRYCYATPFPKQAQRSHYRHDPFGAQLIPALMNDDD